jgi:hypothetical protein
MGKRSLPVLLPSCCNDQDNVYTGRRCLPVAPSGLQQSLFIAPHSSLHSGPYFCAGAAL